MISQAQFLTDILPLTLKFEGGYSNVPNDKGGETYRGISRKYFPTWKGWARVDIYNSPPFKALKQNQIIDELEPMVKDFYYQTFFVKNQLDKLNNIDIARTLFDFSVHGGLSISVLQGIINQFGGNIAVTGKADTATITAINNIKNVSGFNNAILDYRKKRLAGQISLDPTQLAFQDGWFKRVEAFRLATPLNIGIILLLVGLLVLAIYFGRKPKQNEFEQYMENYQ